MYFSSVAQNPWQSCTPRYRDSEASQKQWGRGIRWLWHVSRVGRKNRESLGAETVIHFPGLQGLDKPIVWVFPKLVVCFACGASLFAIPEAELRQLQDGVAA